MGHLQILGARIACYLQPALTRSLKYPPMEDEEFDFPVDVDGIEDVGKRQSDLGPALKDCFLTGELAFMLFE